MPIQVTCTNPQCGQALHCPDETAGKQARCPYCATVVQVPAPAVAVAAPRPSRVDHPQRGARRRSRNSALLPFAAILVLSIGAGAVYVVKKGRTGALPEESDPVERIALAPTPEEPQSSRRPVESRRPGGAPGVRSGPHLAAETGSTAPSINTGASRTPSAPGRAGENAPASRAPAESLGSRPLDAAGQGIVARVKVYRELMASLEPKLRERDLAAIRTAAQELTPRYSEPPFRAFLRLLTEDVVKVQAFMREARETAEEKIGKEITLAGIPMKVVSVDELGMTVDIAGGQQTKPFRKMRGRNILSLVSTGEDAGTPENLYAAGVLYFFDSRYDDARKYLELSGAEGTAKPYDEMMALSLEEKALQSVDKIRVALGEKDFRTIKQLVSETDENYGGTSVFHACSDFLDATRSEMEEALAKRKRLVEGLLAVAAEVADEELKNLEADYDQKAQEIQKQLDDALTDSSYYDLVQVQGYRTRNALIKVTDLSTLTPGERRRVSIWMEAKTVEGRRSKTQKLKDIAEFLKQKGKMDRDSYNALRDAAEKLKDEIQVAKKRAAGLKSKLSKITQSKVQTLKSRRKRIETRINDGQVTKEADVRSYFRGA